MKEITSRESALEIAVELLKQRVKALEAENERLARKKVGSVTDPFQVLTAVILEWGDNNPVTHERSLLIETKLAARAKTLMQDPDVCFSFVPHQRGGCKVQLVDLKTSSRALW